MTEAEAHELGNDVQQMRFDATMTDSGDAEDVASLASLSVSFGVCATETALLRVLGQ